MKNKFNLNYIKEIINTGDHNKIIKLLQEVIKNNVTVNQNNIITQIRALTISKNIGVRFWAKKLLTKQGLYFEKSKFEKLCKIETKNSVENLISKLQNTKSVYNAQKIIKQLCETKNNKAFEFLKNYLSKCEDVFLISYLTKNIGKYFTGNEALKVILPFLSHQDERVIANTIEGLENINDPKVILNFVKLLKHKNNRIKLNAAKALNKTKPEITYSILAKLLKPETQAHFQISACYAAKALKDPRYLPLLEKLLYCNLCFPYALSAMKAISENETTKLIIKNYNSFEPETQELLEPFLTNSTNNNKTQSDEQNFKTKQINNTNKNKPATDPTPEVIKELKESASRNILSPIADFFKQRKLIIKEPEQMFLSSDSKLKIKPVEFAIRGILAVSIIIKCIGEIIFFLQDNKTIVITTQINKLKFVRLLELSQEFIPVVFLLISAFIFRYWLKAYEDKCPRVNVADRVYLYYVTSRLFILNICIAISTQTKYYLLTFIFTICFLAYLGPIALEFSNILGISKVLGKNEAKKLTLKGIIIASIISFIFILLFLLLMFFILSHK